MQEYRLGELFCGPGGLAFGFPCNDFSIVDESKQVKRLRESLYSYGLSAIEKFRPVWFLAENGGARTNADDGRRLGKILEVMRSLGYSLVPHLYKFEEYGIPQARHRIIIIGIRQDVGVNYRVPSPAPYRHLDNSCRNAIENPPIPRDAPNHEFTRQSQLVIKRLSYIKPGENAYTADIPPEYQLRVKGAKVSQTYKRLDPDKPSYTLMGSGGGGTHVYHWSEPRALTNRERARLQTFPDDYVFTGSRESVRRQIGMAVPCAGARIIFEAVLRCFAGISYSYTLPNIIA
ncbi:MAG: DNA (cytosine-5-)-methyltransferase [Synergistaceae bacterium]|nr:DNA (cytosine-5-)-methyltransferase [Synergistaceae bacterium]